MRNKVLIRQLILVVLFEVLFELLAINVLRGTGAYNNYLFLFLDKCLFLTLLIILNTKLTQQKIPFSLKLNKEQRDFIIILTVILIIVGLMNTKNFIVAFTIGVIAGVPEEYLFRGIVLVSLLHLFCHSKKYFIRILMPVIISSILFGLEHFLNLYSQSFSLTMVQVCQTMAMGTLFASIFIRTKNLLFSIICHFCIDFVITTLWGIQNPTGVSFKSSFFITILYLIIGFAILTPTLVDSHLEKSSR